MTVAYTKTPKATQLHFIPLAQRLSNTIEQNINHSLSLLFSKLNLISDLLNELCLCHALRSPEGGASHSIAPDEYRQRQRPLPPPAAPLRPCESVTAGVHGCPRGVAPLRHHTADQGHPGGRVREEKRPNRFTCLVMRGPPTSPLFTSWPRPRHNCMLVGSS